MGCCGPKQSFDPEQSNSFVQQEQIIEQNIQMITNELLQILQNEQKGLDPEFDNLSQLAFNLNRNQMTLSKLNSPASKCFQELVKYLQRYIKQVGYQNPLVDIIDSIDGNAEFASTPSQINYNKKAYRQNKKEQIENKISTQEESLKN